MREIGGGLRPGSRPRASVAVLTAAALVAVAGVAGCEEPAPATRSGPSGKPPRPSSSPTPLWDRSPASLAAVGDSITRGYDACAVFADCPEASWATGTDTAVRSVALRLLGAAGATRRAWNHARSGARMSELPAQMTAAAARRPELVTVMVGANDACRDSPARMTPVADFRRSFTEAMRSLRSTAPKAQVYVSSVPDLKRLWATGRTDPLGREIWKFGICASMLKDADDVGPAAQARRAEVYERVVAYNAVLEDVCTKDLLCRYDGGDVFAFGFTGGQLSRWDWFHPNRNGQEQLAEIAYRNITAPEPRR
ncbi:GDSL-type esterase/lipase family protein [Streptomyces sp. NPDC059176]|uniref:GDSL-type esterase/lipase family protein n=1 Tax=unclassified Streptomyces TaxID=2593676 RepID=UPI0036A9BA99